MSSQAAPSKKAPAKGKKPASSLSKGSSAPTIASGRNEAVSGKIKAKAKSVVDACPSASPSSSGQDAGKSSASSSRGASSAAGTSKVRRLPLGVALTVAAVSDGSAADTRASSVRCDHADQYSSARSSRSSRSPCRS